jgi:murein L,D-transpeptidase YcbB/YkuD
MRKVHLGALAGTALAAVLTATSPLNAQPVNRTSVEARVPLPDAANMPPPTARDLGGSATKPSAFPTLHDNAMRRSPGAPSASARRDMAQGQMPAAPVNTVAPATTDSAKVGPIAGAGADAPVADRLRDLINNKQQIERLVPRKNERDAIVALYQNNRGFAPLWIDRGAQSDRARDAVAYLRGVGADGLDPADYPVPNFSASSAETLAEAELRFTVTMLTYARHALNGRVHFSRVSPNIEYKEAFDAADVLSKLASSTDMARTLEQFQPQHAGYKALKAKYAELRNQGSDSAGAARIEGGPTLRYARDRQGREVLMIDPRVPALRERLGLPAEASNAYNKPLADAVARFQKERGLQVSGQLNNATVDALNPPSRDKQLNTMLVNLERWRWMPRDLGQTHVMLNIPDYHLRVMNRGSQVWMTRVVVGKPSQATPLLSETMKFITVNPTWNVPQSIIYNELLPIYETSDRAVFEKMGLRVERDRDGDIRVFQPPGERNALGRIRFNFPNKFLVYQHDTPEKHYFAHDRRAYSHGCMRVQDPMKYAEVLLSFAAPRGQYTQENLRRMFGGEERQIDFQTQIPVHITYQTAFVDDAGKLHIREDIYGLDSKLASIMKGDERRVADVAIERPADPNFKPTGDHRARLRNVAGGPGGGNPFALFEQLFR